MRIVYDTMGFATEDTDAFNAYFSRNWTFTFCDDTESRDKDDGDASCQMNMLNTTFVRQNDTYT